MTESMVNISSQETANVVSKPVKKPRKIRLDTLFKHLIAFTKHDTWYDLKSSGFSLSTSMAVVKLGVENGFIKREPELRGNRLVYKIKILPGTYKIRLADGEEYTLTIKPTGERRLRIEVSKEIEL